MMTGLICSGSLPKKMAWKTDIGFESLKLNFENTRKRPLTSLTKVSKFYTLNKTHKIKQFFRFKWISLIYL